MLAIKTNKKLGFTLIELLLYIAISSAILLTTSIFLSTLLESRIKNQTIAEVEQQGIQIMQTITQAVRNSDSINLPAAGINGSSLSINTITASTSPTVFDLNNGSIRIKEGAGANINLSNNKVTASGLSFSNFSRINTPGVIKISFTLSAINTANRNEYSFSKTFNGAASLRQP